MSEHTRQFPCKCYIDGDHLMACPLHAAAPALLEALENLVECIEKLADDGRPIPGYAWKNVDRSRAAIRAAKGETT